MCTQRVIVPSSSDSASGCGRRSCSDYANGGVVDGYLKWGLNRLTVGESEPKHYLTISFIFCMAVHRTSSQINSTSGFEHHRLAQDSLLPRLSEEFGGAGDVAGTRPGLARCAHIRWNPSARTSTSSTRDDRGGYRCRNPAQSRAHPARLEPTRVHARQIQLRSSPSLCVKLRRLWNFSEAC